MTDARPNVRADLTKERELRSGDVAEFNSRLVVDEQCPPQPRPQIPLPQRDRPPRAVLVQTQQPRHSNRRPQPHEVARRVDSMPAVEIDESSLNRREPRFGILQPEERARDTPSLVLEVAQCWRVDESGGNVRALKTWVEVRIGGIVFLRPDGQGSSVDTEVATGRQDSAGGL